MKYDPLSIGARAYDTRNNKNMTQLEVSEALGISQATYSKFENGMYDIPLSQLLNLCEYLDIPLLWLVGDKSISPITDSERLDLDKLINILINIRKKL